MTSPEETPFARAQHVARDLLAPHADDPAPRAHRIAAIYAACYLDEPFLGSWFGLATFVARQVYYALEADPPPWQKMMADGNLRIYSTVVPAWLCYRAGFVVPAPLAEAFSTFTRADEALDRSPDDPTQPGDDAVAHALAEEALDELCRVEQRVMLQPTYDALDPVWRPPLRALFGFRLGLAPSSRVIAWDGAFGDPWVADDRTAWMTARVLPAWREARERDMGLIRAEVDRVRRADGVRLADLERAFAEVRAG